MAFNRIKRGTIEFKEFLFLWGAIVFAHICAIPFLYTLQKEKLVELEVTPLTFDLTILAQAILLGLLLAFLGLNLAKNNNFRFPILDRFYEGEEIGEETKHLFRFSFIVATILSLVLFLINISFDLLAKLSIPATGPNYFYRLLAAIYTGISEEVFLRLIIFSALFWLLRKARLPEEIAGWATAILISTLLALVNIPLLSGIFDLSPPLITRIIILNVTSGITYSYLYWKKGFEYAVVTHIVAGMILQFAVPLIA